MSTEHEHTFDCCDSHVNPASSLSSELTIGSEAPQSHTPETLHKSCEGWLAPTA